MKIVLKNIGKLQCADIDIDGITVIAGANNTGKSTVSKALYAFFNGLYKVEDEFLEDKRHSVQNIIANMHSDEEFEFDEYAYDYADEIVKRLSGLGNDFKDFQLLFSSMIGKQAFDSLDRADIKKAYDEMNSVFDISFEQFVSKKISEYYYSEFQSQVNNIYNNKNAEIELTLKSKKYNIVIADNNVNSINAIEQINTEAVYIDDPFILDNCTSHLSYTKSIMFSPLHKQRLSRHLYNYSRNVRINKSVIENIIKEKKLEKIEILFEHVVKGKIGTLKPHRFSYFEDGQTEELRSENLSSGLKLFVMLKMLIQEGVIEENGTLILDEPEIHLHPEWQLILAEIIVLMQKSFGLHVLINTHSPYFLNAIEVYSKKHDIDDKCKYYASKKEESRCNIVDVTEDTRVIYKELAKPFQQLENERARFDD